MMSSASEMDVIKAHTDSIRDEAELFAMRVFYKKGRFTEKDVSEFFDSLRAIISSIRSGIRSSVSERNKERLNGR